MPTTVASGSTSDPSPSGTATSDRQEAVARTLRTAGCVFAEDEARLLIAESPSLSELDRRVRRRTSGEPLEQILGWAELCDIRFLVEPGVFVPRRRTELLVAEAIALAQPGARVADLCCGSGAVGLAIARAVDGAQLYAVDIDPRAVHCAALNAAGSTARVYQGDLDEPLPQRQRGRFDLLTANAPYVPSAEIHSMPPEARVHEARVALDGGVDGLDIQRRVVEIAPRWLRPGGHLLIETSDLQADRTAEAFAQSGLRPRVVRSEELDATVVVGTLPMVLTTTPNMGAG